MDSVKLNSVCTIKNGFAFKSTEYNSNGVPLLRISNFNDGEVELNESTIYVDKSYLKSKSEFIVEKGDVLIALSGATTGKYGIYLYDFPSLLNQRIGLIKNEESDRLFGKYFYYYLNILKHQILRNAGGAAQPNISTRAIGDFYIPLPDLATQKHIASILDDSLALQKKTEKLLKEYDTLAFSLFMNMFGDPLSNPKGWKVKKLKEITSSIRSGNTPKGGSKVYVEKGITFFRSQNVWKNKIDIENVAYIDQSTHDNMKNTSLKYKDILMTKTGRINTENSSLGRAAMYRGKDDQANLNGHVYLIRPKSDVLSEFILFILTTIQYRDYIRRVCVGGIDKRQINKNHIEDFPIIYPSIDEQKKFVEILNSIEQQKELAKQELKESEDLFNCLLQKAFKGELN